MIDVDRTHGVVRLKIGRHRLFVVTVGVVVHARALRVRLLENRFEVDEGAADAGQLGAQYDIVFDADWRGAGEPVSTLCNYELLSADGTSVDSGQWGFSHYELKLRDYVGTSFFERNYDKPPVSVEMHCENQW